MATVLDYFRFIDVTREVVTPENFALVERMAHWQAAIDMIAASPVFGMGAGNYPAVYEWFAVRGWNEALGHAHNFYLNIAAETGFVGLTMYLSIFAVALLHNPRILFHSPWLETETSSVLASASLLLLPTQGSQSFVSVPSKLISYMLAARPVLCCAAGNSDIAITIHDAGCGWVVPADDAATLSQKLRDLSQQPADELSAIGKRGRRYALQHMTRSSNLPRLVGLLEQFR
jgi:glycosyltransferase involved in cell wall biosynthesis